MRKGIIALGLLVFIGVAGAQQPKPIVVVGEIPPEDIPAGTCTESTAGYLGIVGKDKKERTKFTDKEIGEYVRVRLSQGYSVSLYPQASGKVFAMAHCESKH